jgi:hypothetical protein
VYNKVAGSGGVVNQELCFSIVDTNEPAIAISLSPFCHVLDTHSNENQIFLEGLHQEVR